MCDYFTIKIISSKFQILFLQDFQFSSHHSSFQPSSGCHLTSSYSYDAFKLLSWYHVTKNENFLMIYIFWLCRLRNYAILISTSLSSQKVSNKNTNISSMPAQFYLVFHSYDIQRESLFHPLLSFHAFLFSGFQKQKINKQQKTSDPKLKNLHSTYFFLSSKFLEVVALTGYHTTQMSSQRG